jgi:hypothetical protein
LQRTWSILQIANEIKPGIFLKGIARQINDAQVNFEKQMFASCLGGVPLFWFRSSVIGVLFQGESRPFPCRLGHLDLPDRFLLEYISFGRICHLFLTPTK